ncbi:hypothetical protein [Methanolobus sp. WCC4]|uniref:DUF7507 domain-containing protein n=1 Tax=Methanolobus sp. WCC4 TaxID=3125784 RepID=UPI0030FCC187
MKNSKNIWLLTAIFLIISSSSIAYADENDTITTQALYAAKNIDVGTLNVSNDTEYLYITYETMNGWTILETHLEVVNDSEDFPVNGGGNVVPGHFTYKNDSIPAGTTIQDYVIPLEAYLPAKNNTLYIAAHAVVSNGTSEEGAWANGTRFSDKNWATYFTYTITDTDEDGGRDKEDPDDLKISMDKIAKFNDENADEIAQAGENITYYFLVENTGNVTLTEVNVTDHMFTPALIDAPGGFNGTLVPGENVTYTMNYTLVQTDIDEGWVNNTATTAGLSPEGTIVTDSDTENFMIPVEDTGEDVEDPNDLKISIDKVAEFNDENGDGSAQAGENITYYFVVENTGNLTLTEVNVTDHMFTPALIDAPDGFYGSLAPEENVTYTMNYTLSQTDIDEGWVNNTATTAGISPMGTVVTDSDTENFMVPVGDIDASGDVEEKDDDEGSSGSTGGSGGSSGPAGYIEEVTTPEDNNRFFSPPGLAEENETEMSAPDPVPEPVEQESDASNYCVLTKIPWYIAWILLSAICIMSGYGLTQP